ncbi:maltoporin [Pseudoduganella lutea]|uniref:Carbohydrate porin n=1 Tax=Pseudoduganella lutea TaxID=321985 RepID=A0A4P6L4Y6_9BURK|nr:carbohydrate porin [Pseudoduganella lutea]QBE65892.1 carbohydrate porin [Pseudoduganella lutea]
MRIKHIAPALLALASGFPAAALDIDSYLRAHAGVNSAHGGQTCFGLAGAESKYRLGNECGVYGELLLGQQLQRGTDGSTLKAYAMLNLGNNAASSNARRPQGGWTIGLPQAYLALENLPGLGGATLWAGRRYYKRESTHITDFMYWNPSGLGGGIENVPVGGLKFSYAFLHDDRQTMPNMQVGDIASRHDLQLRGLQVNPGGALELGLTLIHGNGSGGGDRHGGSMLTVQHRQTGVLGTGENRLVLQWGTGAGADNGATGDTANGSDVHRLRIVEGWQAQVNERLGAELVAVWQRDTAHDPAKAKTWASAGGRLSYGVTRHVKLLADIGHDRVAPKHGDVRRLTKFTGAVALSAGRGYFDRPELRLFFTQARWNDAARAAAADGDPLAANGIFGKALNGYTIGIALENCW